VWWVNQGRSYEDERDAWLVFAGTERPDGRKISHHQVLADLRPGDVTLHYSRGNLRALGLVHVAGSRSRRPYGPAAERDIGLAVRVEYFELDEPTPLTELPDRRQEVGPFDRNANVRQIYCTGLESQWADTVRQAFRDRWPAGSPWHADHDNRSYWVFQAQPDQWDLVAQLPEMPPGTEDTWTASKHRSKMHAGDGVALW
jgi:hypothetical protein